MKKILLTLALTCISLVGAAQTSYLKCIYTASPVISDQVRQMQNVYLRDMVVSKFKKEKMTYTMYVTNDHYLFQKTSFKNDGSNMLIGAVNNIFIDIHKDSIITEKTIVNKSYVIRDIALSPRWKMTDEQKIINGKHCTKAIARGLLKVEAWFTTEIPFKYGPLGYYGLPGLIVELVTPSDVYSLKSFEYLHTPPVMKSPAKGIAVTEAEFDKIQDSYFAKYGDTKAGEVKIVEK